MSFASFLLQAAATFNLICTGTAEGGRHGEPPSVVRTFTDVVSVNLADRTFCFVPCMRARRIVSVTPAEILFQDEADEGTTHFRKVNRKNGAYDSRHTLTSIYTRSTGRCEQAPFTDFPPPDLRD